MKALLQRVKEAKVDTEGRPVAKIGKGLLVFLGIERGDTERDFEYLLKKVSNLRIFEDARQKMNLSIRDVNGEVLVISQFTLSADCRRGNRPSFDDAEEPEEAKEMYTKFIDRLKEEGIRVSTGEFGSYMQVYLVNDGPVTIMLDSKK
ncbi:MAG: D-aminoacyl-tRNA deacylase [Nitrospirota bacterium]